MLKKSILIAVLIVTANGFTQAPRQIDSVAIRLLDKMSSILGELNSVSVDLNTANDRKNDLNENERIFGTHQLLFSGPSRMTVHSRGDKGNRAIWYNGEFLTYYSYDENNYVSLEAPETTIAMVDSIHAKFGIKFPGVDIFYPSLTDDVLDNFDHVKILGLKTVEDQECFHIMGSSKDMTFQLWISNNAMYLPKRYLFIDKKNGHLHYQGTFSNWLFDPSIPDTVFEFAPPKNARLISILSKS
ncbi:MAG: DUF2092 domain-containing protein [Bacteroidota bacterium]